MHCELLHEARQGNRGAIGKLLNRHVDTLRSLATRELELQLTPSLDVGELVERTLRAAQREFGSFSGVSEDEWLLWLESKLKQNLIKATVSDGERLQVALATLPTVQSQVVRLRQIHGWNLVRISEHLGLDEVVVAGLLRQGLQRLRGIMASKDMGGP